jgi:outer membrane protein assembly factor BamA
MIDPKTSKTFGTFFWLVAGGLIALGLIPSQTVQAQEAAETQRVKVVEIQIHGNEHVLTRDIQAALPFTVEEEITLPDDLMRAELHLKDLGTLQSATSDYRRAGEGIVVIFDVIENPVTASIEITGNRDWNEDRRVTIPVIGLSFRWPFADYLVSTKRMVEILKERGIEPGKVLNTKKLKEALGSESEYGGSCVANPPSPSLCREYRDGGYFLFGIGRVDWGDDSSLRIEVVEGLIESVTLPELGESLQQEADPILRELPLLRPVKLQQLQAVLQKLAQSIYFEPLRAEDISFGSGSAADRVTLTLHLKERRILEGHERIESLRFVGHTAFSEKELLARVELPAEPIDNYGLLTALQGVYRFYRKEGFFMVKFTQEELVNQVLTLRIDEGRIGEIELRQNGYATLRLTSSGVVEIPRGSVEPAPSNSEGTPSRPARGGILLDLLTHLSNFLGNVLGTSAGTSGLPHTQPEIIAKAITVKPGQLVNEYRLADTYRKLLNMGYFKDVGFDFQPLESSRDLKMIIDVAEQEKLGSLNGGFSVSAEGLVGQLSLNGKNLYGSGQDVSVRFDRGILGKTVMNWSLQYQSRTLVQGADYLDLKLFNNTSREGSPEPHLLNRLGAEASLAYPWEDVQLIFGLRHETFTKDFGGDEEPQIEHGLTNSVSLTLNYDDRNNPIFATRGGLASLRAEQAGLFALGTEFTKFQATLIRHFPTFEDQNVALRLVGGAGLNLLDDPQEQFLLGGSTTLRGIASERTASMAYVNLEYRVQFIPLVFSIALFADVGTGYPFDLKKSVGIEGRVALPYVGPVRIAFAWPITDRIEYFKVEFGFGSLF